MRCEIAIREILEARFPAYGFFGEETGSRDADAENLWLVDPIDGTKAFVREYPMFSTQIALMRRGEIVLGVSSAPVYGELCFAERGCGAYLNGKRMAVSDDRRARFGGTVVRQHQVSRGRRPMGALRRARRRGQPHPRLRGFSALSFAGERQDRCGDRIRRQYSRYCSVRGDRQRGGRPVHGFERRSDHAANRRRCSRPMGACMPRCWRRWRRAWLSNRAPRSGLEEHAAAGDLGGLEAGVVQGR